MAHCSGLIHKLVIVIIFYQPPACIVICIAWNPPLTAEQKLMLDSQVGIGPIWCHYRHIFETMSLAGRTRAFFVIQQAAPVCFMRTDRPHADGRVGGSLCRPPFQWFGKYLSDLGDCGLWTSNNVIVCWSERAMITSARRHKSLAQPTHSRPRNAIQIVDMAFFFRSG